MATKFQILFLWDNLGPVLFSLRPELCSLWLAEMHDVLQPFCIVLNFSGFHCHRWPKVTVAHSFWHWKPLVTGSLAFNGETKNKHLQKPHAYSFHSCPPHWPVQITDHSQALRLVTTSLLFCVNHCLFCSLTNFQSSISSPRRSIVGLQLFRCWFVLETFCLCWKYICILYVWPAQYDMTCNKFENVQVFIPFCVF